MDTREEAAVRPNARYDTVFGTTYEDDVDESRLEFLREQTRDEVEVLRAYEEDMEDLREDYPEAVRQSETLTWEDVTVTDDTRELARITTFFHGIVSGEGTEEIREKLRSGDVEWYVNALLVVRGVMNEVESGAEP